MADFTSSFAQGVETGSNLVSRARAQRLQEQQVAAAERRQALMEPLQMKAMEQENMLKGLQITQHLQQKDFIVKAEAAFTKAADLIGNATDLADPALSKQVLALFTNVPMVSKDPRFEMILSTLQGAQELRAKLDKPLASSADMQLLDRRASLRRRLADQTLDPDTRRALQAEFDDTTMSMTPTGLSFESTTDASGQTTTRVTQGKAAGTNAALNNETTRKLRGARDILAMSKEVRKLINVNTMGVRGNINSFLGWARGNFPELLAGVINPQNLNDRQAFLVSARNLSALVVVGMKSDSNISDAERKKLDAIVPSGDWTDDPESGLARLKQIDKNVVEAYRRSAADLKQDIPLDALKPVEIVEQRYAGKITPEEAAELLSASPFFEEEREAARQRAMQLEAAAKAQATP